MKSCVDMCLWLLHWTDTHQLSDSLSLSHTTHFTWPLDSHQLLMVWLCIEASWGQTTIVAVVSLLRASNHPFT